MELVLRALKPYLKRNSLGFLSEERVAERQRTLVDEKIRRIANTVIGKSLTKGKGLRIEKMPLTGYDFYSPFFIEPCSGDFMFPLDDYVRAFTSGTMGKPRSYLLPKTGITHNMRNTGLTFMFLATHDGEKITYEVGDVTYANAPGGAFISGFMHEVSGTLASGWVKKVPSDSLSFTEKVDYFVENYKKIDMAYMNVPLLLEEIYPRIGGPIPLKGFYTQDKSAGILKDKIREVTGSYPKTIFGSTETLFSGLPSIEHPGAFFFDWRCIYAEFITEEDAITKDVSRLDAHPELVSMDGVEVGKRYQLVATPLMNDMTRYVMPDILECVDTGDDILGSQIPLFKYHMRSDKLVVLHNFTRISEEELLEVLSKVKIPYVDFTARRELEGARDYMVVYLEPSKKINVDDVRKRLHEGLLTFDKDWRDISNFLGYVPLKVVLLPRGSFLNYMHKRGSLPKVDRIEMRMELLDSLVESDGTPRRG